MQRMLWLVLACKCEAFKVEIDANMVSIVFGVLYWFIWTRLVPRWRGYKLEEEAQVLDDGTTVTRLVHVQLERDI
jgi:hypothetical protein